MTWDSIKVSRNISHFFSFSCIVAGVEGGGVTSQLEVAAMIKESLKGSLSSWVHPRAGVSPVKWGHRLWFQLWLLKPSGRFHPCLCAVCLWLMWHTYLRFGSGLQNSGGVPRACFLAWSVASLSNQRTLNLGLIRKKSWQDFTHQRQLSA